MKVEKKIKKRIKSINQAIADMEREKKFLKNELRLIAASDEADADNEASSSTDVVISLEKERASRADLTCIDEISSVSKVG